MSVVGFDFGTQNCIVAVAQKGGIDVIANEVSSRQTPCMAAFTEKQRAIGEPAAIQFQRNMKNTIINVKRILGKRANEPEAQADLKKVVYNAKPSPTNDIEIEVFYNGEMQTFTPIQIAAMILNKLKQTTEKSIKTSMKDVVISVPGYWTDHQRRALLDASKIAGLNCLRLMSDHLATALNYGIYKTNLSETEPIRVMFIDMGYANTSVSIVEFLKGKLQVVSTAYDRNLGGRDFDALLLDHFAKEFKEKYKIDILSNARAKVRLELACEKLKKVLSSNPEAVINVECIMNDIDVKGTMKREQFEALCEPLLNRLQGPIKSALEDAKMTPDQLFSVEIVGSSTRLTPVQKRLQEILNRELSKTLNFEEAVARGCALMCAILSPVFKVRDFAVTDITPYPINLSWKPIGGVSKSEDIVEIFPHKSPIPSPKMVTFYISKGFEVLAEYSNPALLPTGTITHLGRWVVSNLPPLKEDPAKIQLKVRVDLHGIFVLESIQLAETYEVEEKKEEPKKEEKKAEEKKGEEKKEEVKKEAEQEVDKMDEDKPSEKTEPSKEGEKKEEVKMKKKVRRIDLTSQEEVPSLLPKQNIQELFEKEISMEANDKLIQETAEAKNSVESYALDMRAKVNNELGPYVKEKDKDTLVELCNKTEDWVYGEGEDVSKSTYLQKLEDMKKLGDPIVRRRYEHENRYSYFNQLKAAIQNYTMLSKSEDPKYEHIDPTERKKIYDKCEAVEKEFNDKMAKQDAQPKHEDPTLTCQMLINAKNDLDHFCLPILNKPKPPKPKEEPKKEENKEEKKEEPKKEANTKENTSTDKPNTPDQMDLD